MQRREHKMPGFRRGDCRAYRFKIAHFPEEDYIGILLSAARRPDAKLFVSLPDLRDLLRLIPVYG